MPECYLLVIAGKPQGPFTLNELKAISIKPGDFLKTPAMDDYKEAHEIAAIREAFNFSKQYVTPQYYAAFDQRVLATVLDWFFVSGFCIIIAFTISLFTYSKGVLLSIALSLLVIIPVFNFVYHIILEALLKQGTYGKQILRIKVSDLNGSRLDLRRSIVRNLAKILSVPTFYVGYLMSFFNKKQQCLHDMIAGTIIIKDRLI